MVKVIKTISLIALIAGLIFAVGVVGEQDRSYAETSHSAYEPQGGFIK